jgi:hypothetical protein
MKKIMVLGIFILFLNSEKIIATSEKSVVVEMPLKQQAISREGDSESGSCCGHLQDRKKIAIPLLFVSGATGASLCCAGCSLCLASNAAAPYVAGSGTGVLCLTLLGYKRMQDNNK